MFPLLSHIYLATHVRTRDYSGHAQDNEEDSHHYAQEETVDAVRGDDAATTTTKAPVGPPICVFDPPKAEISKPVTMAHSMLACGVSPEAMAEAMASGRATRPTVIPAITSSRNLWRL